MTVSSATFGAGSPTKAAALLQLARKRQSSHLDDYACIGDFHDGIYECDHVSPWTKSGCNLDAEVMVVGQDWSSADVLEGNGRPDPVRARLGYDPGSRTNKNLDRLLQVHFGLERADCYLTNIFPFVKPGKKNASIRLRDMERCARDFTLNEVRIVAPRLVLCLGLQTFKAFGRAAGQREPRNMDEAVNSPFDFEGSTIHCVAHAGDLGMNNRRRDRVVADWQRIASSLRGAPGQQQVKRAADKEGSEKVDGKDLTQEQQRKLKALRKLLGREIADQAFLKWLGQQDSEPAGDPTARKIEDALNSIVDKLSFQRGSSYVVRCRRGRVVVERVEG